jgi:uncharacterized protein GlcG (DUF336 family)
MVLVVPECHIDIFRLKDVERVSLGDGDSGDAFEDIADKIPECLRFLACGRRCLACREGALALNSNGCERNFGENRIQRTEASHGSASACGGILVRQDVRVSTINYGGITMKKCFAVLPFAVLLALPTLSQAQIALNCGIPAATVAALQAKLATVIALPDANGGIFKPNRMWSAIVDRQGILCSVINSENDPWPGSRAIAIAKASTANDFSNSALALSTANLYAPTQPGGSLYGLNNSNPFNPLFQPQAIGVGFVPGGIITFGGGVALYSGGKVIGGLGVSGDSSCADHAIAFRMRKLAALDGVPSGVAPDNTDNIIYAATGTPPTGFQQPHCFPSDLTPAQVEGIP